MMPLPDLKKPILGLSNEVSFVTKLNFEGSEYRQQKSPNLRVCDNYVQKMQRQISFS